MKIRYLGTAAAEGWPAVFCNCEYCKKAKEAGGKNLRTRSQAIIDDELLLDFPADTYAHILKNKLDFSAVKYCFITHSHLDHFMPMDLFFRDENYYAHNFTQPTLEFFGNERVKARFDRFIGEEDSERFPQGVSFKVIRKFEKIKVGKYTLTPLPAYHAEGENAFVYLIESEGKRIPYLHDTGIPKEEFFKYFEENPVRCDLISYDCTYGAIRSGGGHMGLDSVPELRKRFEEMGISDEKTVSVVNHFSHNGQLIHDELEKAAAKLGFLTAYDGAEIEV
ncbi:MAG: hypothetical protein KBS44_01755 [Clostridiales bacterium]|nr:hypothetical protein [Candidatus Coliplasma equi]